MPKTAMLNVALPFNIAIFIVSYNRPYLAARSFQEVMSKDRGTILRLLKMLG